MNMAMAFAAPSVKVSPAALSFSYQEGSSALPTAQTLTATIATSSAAPTTVVVSSGGSPWITYTPQSGKTTLTTRISVNPTGLPIGQYSESIVLITPETLGDPVTVPVSLAVKAAPADLKVSPMTVTITHRLGDAPPRRSRSPFPRPAACSPIRQSLPDRNGCASAQRAGQSSLVSVPPSR